MVIFNSYLTPRLAKLRNEKKQREKEKREMEVSNRRHLANMRVVQKNLCYVVGFSARVLAEEQQLRQYEYFGQFGKIFKVVVNRKNTGGYNNTDEQRHHHHHHHHQDAGVYVTFNKKEDAAKCIKTIDGTVYDGRLLRASFGTTKYCTYYLRGLQCQNPGCMYLHEPGEEADSYTKEEMSNGKHHTKSNAQGVALGGNDHDIGPPAPFGSLAGQTTRASVTDETLASAPVTSTNKNPWKPVTSEHADESAPGSPSSSALPRAAAWANRNSSTLSAAAGFQAPEDNVIHKDITSELDGGLYCDVLDIIPADGRIIKEDHRNKINTANLHRHLLLAQQAREDFIQMVARAAAVDGPKAKLSFVFDPFRSRDKGAGNGDTHSRFGFAQKQQAHQLTDLPTAFASSMRFVDAPSQVPSPANNEFSAFQTSTNSYGNNGSLKQQQQQSSLLNELNYRPNSTTATRYQQQSPALGTAPVNQGGMNTTTSMYSNIGGGAVGGSLRSQQQQGW